MNTRNRDNADREYKRSAQVSPRILHNFRTNDRVCLSRNAPPAQWERFGNQTGTVVSVTPDRIRVRWPGLKAFVSYTERQLDFGQQ